MFSFFYPGKSFPSISVTATACALNCQHCRHHYLEGMIPAETPERFYSVLKGIAEKGGRGALVSGGSTPEGKVPLTRFYPIIRRIKQETRLVLNAHTGFIGAEEAKALAETGVDVVSVDVVGSRETIERVYGLDKAPKDYASTLRALRDAGIPYIVPHITVGLHFGKVMGELEAVRQIKQAIRPDAVVINALIPTRGTPMQGISPPSTQDILGVIEYAVREIKAPVLLGCMRPGRDPELEIKGEEAGLSGIVVPSPAGRRTIEAKRECRIVEACCALYPML